MKKKWWFKLFFKPDLYLKGLLISSIGIGAITAIMLITFHYYGGHMDHETIPSAFHSILGIVLGLLLVFRTNTAYERWWKGREYLSHIETNYIYIKSKLDSNCVSTSKKQQLLEIMVKALDRLEWFLVHDNDKKVKKEFIDLIQELQNDDQRYNYGIDLSLKELIDYFNALERIRDTPIPQSYSMHIKVSILMYFLTLPFGVLYVTGYWSILLVMILYYVVAGIEIISNEIENPFFGDPNDLPVKKYIAHMKEHLQ
jgi:putative membrane protein